MKAAVLYVLIKLTMTADALVWWLNPGFLVLLGLMQTLLMFAMRTAHGRLLNGPIIIAVATRKCLGYSRSVCGHLLST